MTLVCVPIAVHDVPTALADAEAARLAGADLVEFRVDAMLPGGVGEAEIGLLRRLCADSPLPAIVTCRAAAEGGAYDGPDDERLALYEHLGTADHPPRYVDLELAAYERSANLRQKAHLAIDWPARRRANAPGLVLSLHDFGGRPADLSRRVARLAEAEAAAVVKVAYRARSIRDNLELLEVPSQTGRPTIALGIGEFGLMSRVLAPKFGGFLTFASLRRGGETAPGQPTIADLLGAYRFRSIGPRTRVYGVVGWPVGHSLSPTLHNAGFERVGHDGVYLPMPLAGAAGEESFAALKATLLEFIEHPRLSFCGASVTIPHKESLARLASAQGWEADEATRATGAANTLVVERDADDAPQRVRVMNTDVPALAASLAEAMGTLAGATVGVIGAGGVGRAAAWGLARAGATVVLYNRDLSRAEEVAAHVNGALRSGGEGRGSADQPAGRVVGASWALLAKSCADAFVNCTPLGMTGGPDPAGAAMTAEAMRGCASLRVVMDTVYAPRVTPLLAAAGACGLRTVGGLDMFVRQAALQFEAWTGRPGPLTLFGALASEAAAAREGSG
ncbi:MAG: type I 3-dehydroquinate dehydratase [Planctomycetota bacterium]|nr:type I 3-dehydroquinate dehydratase [Planctomycetota bacterium]